MSSLNEFDEAEEQSRASSDNFALEEYVVERAIADENKVEAHPLRESPQEQGEYRRPESLKVLVPSFGDSPELSAGDKVVVGYLVTGRPVVVGLEMHVDDVPSAEPDERVFGHGASNTVIRFKPDGEVIINAGGQTTIEGDAVVNGNVDLGGTGGSEIARKGDAVSVSDPDSGTLTGTIDEGSSKASAVD